MSRTEKTNDFFPLGMTHIREVSFPVPTYFSIQIEFDRLKEENKCLLEQIAEANKVIKNMKLCMDDKYDYDCVAEDVDIYFKKWSVK